jgi:predicted nucleotidyltransferase
MRITGTEKDALIAAVHGVDRDAKVWLFGSRTNDSKKGGDIDIAILSSIIHIPERMRIRRNIIDRIGERKIDIIVSADGSEPFFRMAIETGIRIDDRE